MELKNFCQTGNFWQVVMSLSFCMTGECNALTYEQLKSFVYGVYYGSNVLQIH